MSGSGGHKRWRFRRGFRLEERRRDLEDELRFHFEQGAADLEREGWTKEEAAREVRRRFGDEASYRRKLGRIDRGMERRRRVRRGTESMGSTMREVLRGLVRSPGLTVGVVLAFTLGIGANATMFGVVDRLLLTPPSHIAEADAVKRLVVDRYVPFLNERVQSTSMTYPDYKDLREVEQFSGVAAYQPFRLLIGRGEAAERAASVLVTASYWRLLGVRPELGRFFTEDEDRIGGPRIAVVGHRLWVSRFGGERSVLGRTIDFGHGPFAIVGVAPKGFTGVDLGRVDIWLPLETAGALLMGEEWLGDSRGRYWLRAVGRVAPDVSVAVAADAATAAHRAGRTDARVGGYDPEARVLPLPLIVARAALQADDASRSAFGANSAREARVALWLAGVSLLVLLIACVNVANLLLARAIQRRRETAIRVALGVSRRHLIGQAVTEGVALAVLGGAAALMVTRWGGDIIRSVLLPGVEFADHGLSPRVLPFVLGVSVVAGLIAAIVPAIETSRRDPSHTIRAGAGGVSRSASRVRGGLSMAQAALSVVLLVGAGLFLRSVQNLRSLDLGFDPDGLYIAMPDIEGGSFTEEEKRAFYTAAADRLVQQPGVRSVAWSQSVPYYYSWSTAAELPGRDSLPTPHSGGPYINGVNLDYFRTLGLRVERGRAFEQADFGSGLVVIVNDALADLWWPGGDPLGECLLIGSDAGTCSTVVGVVEDARRGSMLEEPNPQFYVPNTHPAIESFGEAIFVRTGNDDVDIAALRGTLLDLSPRLRFVNIQPISDFAASEMRAWTLGATLFSLFGILALVVAALGLHSVLAFDVAQRRREIGLRNALGAGTRRILAVVVGRAIRITVAGVAAGVMIALLIGPRIEQLLFDTPARDPWTIAVVTVVLMATAVLAAGIPALRAARVDPNTALRTD